MLKIIFLSVNFLLFHFRTLREEYLYDYKMALL